MSGRIPVINEASSTERQKNFAINKLIAKAQPLINTLTSIAANSFLGNNTASAGAPTALTTADAKALLAIAAADVSGLAAIATSGSASDLGSGTLDAARLPAAAALLNAQDQTLSGGANVTSFSIGTVSSGTTTIDCGKGPLQTMTNGGASTIAAPANDGSCIVKITNNGSAGTITFSGFSVGASIGDSLTTTNGNKFFISIVRIGGDSTYSVKAAQ